jgi:hypothetical protein
MGPARRTAWLFVTLTLLLFTAPAWAQEQARPAQPRAVEAALSAVAKHLAAPYALYLYESLTAQVLYNETILERPNSPSAPLANDSLWALEIISKSILVEGQDGQYLDIRRVPPFFEDLAHRYTNPSHYWPDRKVTKETRREQLAAWYALYLMLLVGNATQDEIIGKLKDGAFERDPGMLTPGGPSLVDRLKKEGVLADETHQLVHIRRAGPAGAESLTFPAYMDRWKGSIHAAYDVSPSP